MRFFRGDSINFNQRLLALLQACRKSPSLETTKTIHALTIILHPAIHQPIFLSNNLMCLYTSLGHLSLAHQVFDEMPQRNAVTYNTMINAHGKYGYVERAWNVFCKMRNNGFSPTQFTVAGILSCGELDVCGAVQLHAISLKNGLFCLDAFIGTALLCLYGKFGCLDWAVQVFEDMPMKSLVTWNSMISLFGQNEFVDDCLSLFRELVRMQACLSECSLFGVLSGLASEVDLETGEQLHGLVIKKGLDCEISVANSLITMYAKCGGISSAEKLFVEAPCRDIISWNVLISAMVKSENSVKALEHFVRMLRDGLLPNRTTFVSLVSACTCMQIPDCGRSIHALVIKNGFESDVVVESSLVDLYAKCGNLEDAHLCFDDICEKNVVSWNSLISGYADKGSSICVSLFLQMLQSGFQPNEFTFSAVLKSVRVVELQQLHSLVVRMGYLGNEYVLSSLMTSYARSGLINDALVLLDCSAAPFGVVPLNIIAGMYNRSSQYHETVKLLSTLEQPDTISWNIVIAACARSGNFNEVFDLFKHMVHSNIRPDNHTFVSLLSACTKLCNLALGSSIHGLIIKTNFSRCDVFVCNILIDMYGKSGSITSSVKIFEETRDRNLITWTALISSLGIHGYAHEAFERFREMELLGFKPDRVAFIAMLTVCRHGGLVREGMELFRKMASCYGIKPEMEHYHCAVDLLVRNAHMKEAEDLIAAMPFPPDALIWRSFLEGCKRYRQVNSYITPASLSQGCTETM